MSYVVLIDRIGQDGLPIGRPTMRNAHSEAEALAILSGAAADPETAQQQLLFSLYDHGKRLLISYASRDHALVPLGAFAP